MAVAFDVATTSLRTDTSDPYNWTHTPSGTPRGIVVAVSHQIDSAYITGITYGGVAMSQIGLSKDLGGEPGRVWLWFLGSGIPTGAQTVSADLSSGVATDILFVSISLTATGDTEVIDSEDANPAGTNIANPQATLSYAGRTSIAFSALHSGLPNVTDAALLTGMTAVASQDWGVAITRIDRQTTPGTSDFTIGYTSASDDVGMFAAAITQVVGGGSPQDITSPALLGGVSLHNPTVLPGAVTTSPARLGVAALLSPQVVPGVVAVLPSLLGTASLLTPTRIKSPYASYVLGLKNSDLLSYIRLGEPSGTTFTAEVGPNGVYTGTPTLGVAGLIDNDGDTAVYFNGDGIADTDNTVGGGSSTGTAVAIWAKFDSPVTDGDHVFFRWDLRATGFGYHWFGVNVASGVVTPRWEYYDGTADRTVSFATWTPDTAIHSWVAVHDFSTETVKLYIDGTLHDTVDVSANGVAVPVRTTRGLVIGRYVDGDATGFEGTLDEFSLWKNTLTAGEITDLHVAGAGLTLSVSPSLLGTTTLYSPTILRGAIFTTPSRLGVATLHSPSLSVGSVSVAPARLGVASLFAPQLSVGAASVTLPVLGGASLLSPAQIRLSVAVLSVLGIATLHAPVVVPGAALVVPARLGTATLLSPQLIATSSFVSVALLGGTSLFSPVISAGSVGILPDVLGGAELFIPVLSGATSFIGGLSTSHVLLGSVGVEHEA